MLDYSSIGKILLLFGIILLFFGAIFLGAGKLFNIDRLPGDILIRKGNVTIFFPIVTMIILSIIATIVLNILLRK